MRHQYTPIFRDLLDSSLWASATPATRCTWITFLLDADPEGCVPTSIPGLARRAHVTVDEARIAVAMLEAPDPDSRTPDFEGRRIAKVPGGWQVLNFVAKRELAKLEAEKARKRKWAAANGKRTPANDNHDASNTSALASSLDASSETLDAPKPKPKPKPLSSEGEDPPTPLLDGEAVDPGRMARWADAPVLPAIVRQLDEWGPTEAELAELRDEARIAGVPDFDARLKDLATGPIGGARGVLAHKVAEYVRAQFPKWKTWRETNDAKAQRDAEAGPGRRFAGAPVPPEGPKRKRVQGAPDWVYEEHADFAKQHALDLPRAAKAYARQAHIPPSALAPADVFAPFLMFLERLAKERAREASA